MSVSKERRLCNMRKGLERESAKALDLQEDALRAEQVSGNQTFLVIQIERNIRDLEEEEDVSFELIDFGQMAAKVAYLKGNEIGLRFDREAEDQMANWLAPMQAARH